MKNFRAAFSVPAKQARLLCARINRRTGFVLASISGSFLLAAGGMIQAQVPEGYYDNALNTSKYELKTALWRIIFRHEQLSYAELWTAFGQTDVDEDGYIIDMYNHCQFEFQEDQCGSGSSGNAENQCVCYNREHSIPQSWFDGDSPMYTDLFHLYPVSGYINSRRGNNPFGEVGSASFTSTAGSRLGPSNYPGYSGTVFEPNDEYKGDFARIYFYMVTCYEDKVSTWESDMLDHNSYPAFTDWALGMLLRWAEEDPVSKKEIDRNNAVYSIQGNRNPYVDYPGLEQYVWGNMKDMAFSYDNYSTGITVTVPTKDISDVDVYTITGMKVRSDIDLGQATEGLDKGVYIIGKKKYVVK